MATQSNRSMISEVSICNQAMSWLGANEITSLDDPSKEAEYCRNNYPFLRDAVLEERMWTFATDRAISTVADRDAWGVQYQHPLPLEWLAVYRVYCTPGNTPDQGWPAKGWRREGDFILAQESTIYMWGLKRIVDTGKFTQLFVQALAARMASDLAIPITENRQLQADMWGLYQNKLREAAARDGAQGANDHIRSSGLVSARSYGTPLSGRS